MSKEIPVSAIPLEKVRPYDSMSDFFSKEGSDVSVKMKPVMRAMADIFAHAEKDMSWEDEDRYLKLTRLILEKHYDLLKLFLADSTTLKAVKNLIYTKIEEAAEKVETDVPAEDLKKFIDSVVNQALKLNQKASTVSVEDAETVMKKAGLFYSDDEVKSFMSSDGFKKSEFWKLASTSTKEAAKVGGDSVSKLYMEKLAAFKKNMAKLAVKKTQERTQKFGGRKKTGRIAPAGNSFANAAKDKLKKQASAASSETAKAEKTIAAVNEKRMKQVSAGLAVGFADFKKKFKRYYSDRFKKDMVSAIRKSMKFAAMAFGSVAGLAVMPIQAALKGAWKLALTVTKSLATAAKFVWRTSKSIVLGITRAISTSFRFVKNAVSSAFSTIWRTLGRNSVGRAFRWLLTATGAYWLGYVMHKLIILIADKLKGSGRFMAFIEKMKSDFLASAAILTEKLNLIDLSSFSEVIDESITALSNIVGKLAKAYGEIVSETKNFYDEAMDFYEASVKQWEILEKIKVILDGLDSPLARAGMRSKGIYKLTAIGTSVFAAYLKKMFSSREDNKLGLVKELQPFFDKPLSKKRVRFSTDPDERKEEEAQFDTLARWSKSERAVSDMLIKEVEKAHSLLPSLASNQRSMKLALDPSTIRQIFTDVNPLTGESRVRQEFINKIFEMTDPEAEYAQMLMFLGRRKDRADGVHKLLSESSIYAFSKIVDYIRNSEMSLIRGDSFLSGFHSDMAYAEPENLGKVVIKNKKGEVKDSYDLSLGHTTKMRKILQKKGFFSKEDSFVASLKSEDLDDKAIKKQHGDSDYKVTHEDRLEQTIGALSYSRNQIVTAGERMFGRLFKGIESREEQQRVKALWEERLSKISQAETVDILQKIENRKDFDAIMEKMADDIRKEHNVMDDAMKEYIEADRRKKEAESKALEDCLQSLKILNPIYSNPNVFIQAPVNNPVPFSIPLANPAGGR